MERRENSADKRMKKVAVFGKPGAGKSTLSKELDAATGIELYPLDLIEYQKNGQRISKSDYAKAGKTGSESNCF
jgi:adenylate kinase family enzyme